MAAVASRIATGYNLSLRSSLTATPFYSGKIAPFRALSCGSMLPTSRFLLPDTSSAIYHHALNSRQMLVLKHSCPHQSSFPQQAVAGVRASSSSISKTADTSASCSRLEVYEKDDHGNTAFHRAVIAGDISTLKDLRKANANLDTPNKCGITPMDSALKKGDYAIISWLRYEGARTGADILSETRTELWLSQNYIDSSGFTILQKEIRSGNIKKVQFYLSVARSNPNISKGPTTCLDLANESTNEELITALHLRGALTLEELQQISNRAEELEKARKLMLNVRKFLVPR